MCTRADDHKHGSSAKPCQKHGCTARCDNVPKPKKAVRRETRDRQLWTHAAIAPWNGERIGRAQLVRRFKCSATELMIIGATPLGVGETFAVRGCDLPWQATPRCGTVVATRVLPDQKILSTVRFV